MSAHFGRPDGSRHVPVLPGTKSRAPLRPSAPAPEPAPRHAEPAPAAVPDRVKPRRKRRHGASRIACLVGLALTVAALAAGFLSRLYLSFDVFSNFTPQLAVAAAAFLIA